MKETLLTAIWPLLKQLIAPFKRTLVEIFMPQAGQAVEKVEFLISKFRVLRVSALMRFSSRYFFYANIIIPISDGYLAFSSLPLYLFHDSFTR